MSFRLLFGSLIAALIIPACHPAKKAAVTPPPVTSPAIVKTDTVVPVPEEPVKREIYRASAPISHDLIHTELEVAFDWDKSQLIGRASLQLKPHFYPTNKLYLNARGMEIKNVEVYEEASVTEKTQVGKKTKEEVVEVWNAFLASSFKYENDSIKINLGRTFTRKENYFVVVDYIAKPNELKSRGSNAITDDKGLYFINPKGENTYKMPQVWTQGETQSSSAWFPTIDNPNTKTLQEIFMTVDDKYTTLSNGLLVDAKKNPDGTRTDHWKMDLPHSPYLAMMAVGEFKKVVDEPWNGKEISYYVEKEYEPYAKAIFGDTREMIEFYSTKLGVAYPWSKYAQVVARDYVSGAMENTSATLHGDFMVYQTPREMIDGKKGNSVIAHELFHQWFGDLVTSESWSNLPLNESFATYGEYLWEEYKNGRESADYHHYQSKQGYLASQKEVNLIRYNYDDKEDMFDGFSYNKGGQILHMLRKAVGDEAFFAGLKKYLEVNKYKAAEIHHLRLAFEDVTGQDMNWFFNQWFLNKGRPKLKISKLYNPVKNTVELTVEQTQDLKNVPLYRLPLEVEVYNDGTPERTHIVIEDQKQTFTLTAYGVPQLVNFDAERQLLCDIDYPKTNDEYIFQYKTAPLFEDRMEALKQLESKLSDPAVLNLFKDAAKNDKLFALRNYAITKLDLAPGDKAQVKMVLIDIYNSDKNTRTRAKALSVLNKNFATDADIKTLNEKALGEQSYAICGEALQAIAKSDPVLAMERAKLFEKESGKDVLFPVAQIYSTQGSDAQIPFFQNATRYVNGFEILTFVSLYSKTAARSSSKGALTAAKDIEMLSKGANKYTKYGIVKSMKDLLTAWENKEKTLKGNIEQAKLENKDLSNLEKELAAATETREALMKIYNGLK
ncbi:MAG TPA: M1 family aminopeptidase [Bacteroidia bacterium]|nr:M1 family aminopeptidase [Bacteroidia bacterium]